MEAFLLKIIKHTCFRPSRVYREAPQMIARVASEVLARIVSESISPRPVSMMLPFSFLESFQRKRDNAVAVGSKLDNGRCNFNASS